MKKILIFILIVIVAIFAYNQYKNYMRFSPKNADYKLSDAIDLEYHDKTTLYKYYEAIETTNLFVTSQWSANRIDIRNPEDGDRETKLALKQYAEKRAKIKFYEAQLEKSKRLKIQGLDNNAIKMLETQGITVETYQKHKMVKNFKDLMHTVFPKKPLRKGEKSAFIFELQKLLVKKGYDIPVDGVYKSITTKALKDFEEKNNQFPDGQIDLMSFELLLD